jgi:hypothetical protein
VWKWGADPTSRVNLSEDVLENPKPMGGCLNWWEVSKDVLRLVRGFKVLWSICKGNTRQSPTNMFEHVQTSMKSFANTWTTSRTLKQSSDPSTTCRISRTSFKLSLCTSYCLQNIFVCFIPYSDMCPSFLDHLFTCILTL